MSRISRVEPLLGGTRAFQAVIVVPALGRTTHKSQASGSRRAMNVLDIGFPVDITLR